MNTIHISVSEETLTLIKQGLPSSAIADLHPPFTTNPVQETLHLHDIDGTLEENLDLFGTLHYTITIPTQTFQNILPILTYYTRMGTDIHGTIEWVTGEQKQVIRTQTFLTIKDLPSDLNEQPQTNEEASAKLIENWGQTLE